MSDDPAKAPRFPTVAALLCAACAGAAVGALLEYSYAREVTPRGLAAVPWLSDTHPLDGRYVHLAGRKDDVNDLTKGTTKLRIVSKGREPEVVVILREPVDGLRAGAAVDYVGRVEAQVVLEHGQGLRLRVCVDTTASRWHPAPIAGLIVGAMGVFVFTVALRHWVRERRRFHEEARGPNNGVERTQDA